MLLPPPSRNRCRHEILKSSVSPCVLRKCAATMPAASGRGVANAEELFRSKRIGKIQKTEGITRREICAKEELRQLVSRSYTTRLATAAPRQVPDYQVDPGEHIWGRLDEGMLLEVAGRYIRAHVVHSLPSCDAAAAAGCTIPAARAPDENVEAFRPQIMQPHELLLSSCRSWISHGPPCR